MTAIDSAQDYPIVALSLQTSGIHPTTSHIVRIDARTCSADGKPGNHYQWLVNPQENPGPVHLHGATKADISQAPRFSSILKQLDLLIDGRTLILHNAPRMWGYIVADSRRAMNQVARMNRNRNRGRKRSVGKVPQPKEIIDTLASWRRHGHFDHDTRIRAVAATLGCAEPGGATANLSRAAQDAASVAAEETALILDIYQQLLPDVVHIDPADLQADPFGLQRHHIRVDAMVRAPEYPNPGIYTPETGLVYGMEVAIAPEILMDATELIERLDQANLTYTEKITRTASLLVCNKPDDFVGKAMHAHRKGIPILSDAEFLAALDTVRAPSAAEIEAVPELPRVPRLRTPKIVLKKKRKPAKPAVAKRGTGSAKASDNAAGQANKAPGNKTPGNKAPGNGNSKGGKKGKGDSPKGNKASSPKNGPKNGPKGGKANSPKANNPKANSPKGNKGQKNPGGKNNNAKHSKNRAKQNSATPTAKLNGTKASSTNSASLSNNGSKAQGNKQNSNPRGNRNRRRRRHNSGQQS